MPVALVTKGLFLLDTMSTSISSWGGEEILFNKIQWFIVN